MITGSVLSLSRVAHRRSKDSFSPTVDRRTRKILLWRPTRPWITHRELALDSMLVQQWRPRLRRHMRVESCEMFPIFKCNLPVLSRGAFSDTLCLKFSKMFSSEHTVAVGVKHAPYFRSRSISRGNVTVSVIDAQVSVLPSRGLVAPPGDMSHGPHREVLVGIPDPSTFVLASRSERFNRRHTLPDCPGRYACRVSDAIHRPCGRGCYLLVFPCSTVRTSSPSVKAREN